MKKVKKARMWTPGIPRAKLKEPPKPVNRRFPGRPRYKGPNEGIFGFVHHAVLYEYSSDIRRRVDHIKNHKPIAERPIRLRHLVYLGKEMSKFDELSRDETLARIKRYIPRPLWNGCTLTLKDGTGMEG